MKKILFLLMMACPLLAGAKTSLRPMLVEGNTWRYEHHHFEAKEYDPTKEYPYDLYNESVYSVFYTVHGDTVINNRTYKKMFRQDDNTWKSRYYGAFREDEEGCVWQYDYAGDEKDFMICDVTCLHYPGVGQEISQFADVIKIGEQLLHRYHWNGMTGVEGVGMAGKGLVHYLFEPEPDCVCDYESFNSVWMNGFEFTANDFQAPKYIELTDSEKLLVEKNNDFAYNLFLKTRTEDSKVLSPLSITYALGMLNNGAVGKTQQEICDVLGFDDVDAQNEFCLKMYNELYATTIFDNTTKALIANTIFVNQGQGWELQYDFKRKASDYYYAHPEARNFNDGKTCDVINQWASDHTEGMIEEVLKKDEFNPYAVSYLLNAIYFKGMWSNPFNASHTVEEPFAGAQSVPMMRNHLELSYAENDLYQTVLLPYGNGTYGMQVYLPREGKTIEEVAESLRSGGERPQMRPYDIDLKLPRFETTTNQQLVEVMKDLGMPTAFSPTEADFSRLCVDNYGENIYIGLMKQVAKIKLDEKGTEAAAVTVIGVDATSLNPREAQFHATRPFLYTICEQSTGVILFIGQFMGKGISAAITTNSLAAPHPADNIIHDLCGRRVTSPQKGIYIRNGRKLVK